MFKAEILSICPSPGYQMAVVKNKDGSTSKIDINCFALVRMSDPDDEEATWLEVSPVIFHQGSLVPICEMPDGYMTLEDVIRID